MMDPVWGPGAEVLQDYHLSAPTGQNLHTVILQFVIPW